MKSMKTTYTYLYSCLFTLALVSCNNGLDSIKAVDPGEDTSAPVVSVIYPSEGTLLRVTDDVTDIDINCDVTDDIELKNVLFKLDDQSINEVSDFTDYRHRVIKFNYANVTNGSHTLSVVAQDLTGKETTSIVHFTKAEPYKATYDGEVMYFPFDGDYTELLSITDATVVGTPSFGGDAKVGLNSYSSTEGSYISFPADAITANHTCTFTFWYNVNAVPDRAGILVLGDEVEAASGQRMHGFRLFREGSNSEQRIKANVGIGTTDVWCDGFVLPVDGSGWKFIALVIDTDKISLYYDGELGLSSDLSAPVDWTNCTALSILNGSPSFDYWNHKYDGSMMDDLRGYNKALTQEEIKTIMAAN